MIIESIFLAIFVLSFGGVLLILVRKLPTLHTLPQNGTTGIKKHQYILEIENKIKDIFLAFEKQIWLHKMLSWAKIIVLKIEVRIDKLLHGIRRKAQKIEKEKNSKK